MKNKEISRRIFLKELGTGATAITAAAALSACGSERKNGASPYAQRVVPTDKMTYRVNHNNNDKISILGYGCMRWPMIPNPSGRGEIINQESVNRLIAYAMEHGINYYDTSPAYCQGLSEAATGEALSRFPREEFFIATKLSNFAPSTWSREASISMYHNSFKELRVNVIDYYLLHSIGNGGIETFNRRYVENGMIEYLMEERRAGRIRNLGFSFHGTKEVFDQVLAMHERVHWDFVQIQLNYVDLRHASGPNVNAEYLYAELVKRNIPAIIMEPLLGGRLSNLPEHIMLRLKRQRPDESVASWAFRFAGSYENVLTVLSGMTYMEHLQDNLLTYSPLVPLTGSDYEFLEQTAQLMLQYPTIPCNDCKYCMPCPYGIDIPSVLLHYNRCVNEGNVPRSSQDENYRKARRAFLIGYDRSVPRLRQADHCIGCRQCNEHCPQSIDIPAQMQRINNFVEQLKRQTI